jgi:hypothetical protein
LEKFLNDSLTGIVWQDDAQIVWILRSKSITSNKSGYTIFYAQEIDDQEPKYNELIQAIKENIYIGDNNEDN